MQATDILISLFNQFKKEKKYLSNLSERILNGYQEAFDNWQKHHTADKETHACF